LKLLVPANQIVENKPIRKQNLLLIGLLILQLIYGALMAGHKAANVASTWPKINGAWLPDSLFSHQPFLLNFIDNTILIHFIHRGLAYLIVLIMIVWSIKLFKSANTPILQGAAKFPLLFTLLQVVLGIASVLTSSTIVPGIWGSFEWMAQLHQLTGMLLLLSLVTILFLVRPKIC
jgi:cytochrome c oxidase assembly protein subunit 15